MGTMKFLGSAKISSHFRASIVQEAAERLNIQVGDHILFYENEKGEIIIKKG